MVKLIIKHRDEKQFLYETSAEEDIEEVVKDIVSIYNGRLKIQRICSEMEELAKYGVFLPVQMQGLTEEQVMELKLRDEWGEKCIPSGGFIDRKDPIGRRNGKSPNEKISEVITKTVSEAKAKISKKLVDANMLITQTTIKDALDMLRGAVMIVYPMGIPPYDPIRQELENKEDLSGTQAALDVLEPALAQMWWAGKQFEVGKKLQDYIGKNEKTKIVVKLQKKGHGAPAREPLMTEEEQKQMMLKAFRRQEEIKKLEEEEDNSYLNSDWADNKKLQRSFQGLKDIKWRPR